MFADARDEKRLGEASTRYLVSPAAPAYVHEFKPQARIIAMLRNPVDFIYALHNERVSQGEEQVTDFASALALDDERRAGTPATRRAPTRSAPSIAIWPSSASNSSAGWTDSEPRGYTRSSSRTLRMDTAGEFRRVLEFLEVDPEYQPETFEVRNRSHRRRGGLGRKAFDSPPAQWVAHGLIPTLIGKNATSRLARRFRHSRFNRRPNPRPPLPPELRRSLQADFRADVQLFGRCPLERDLETLRFDASRTPAGEPHLTRRGCRRAFRPLETQRPSSCR